jgi:hypothetical protein
MSSASELQGKEKEACDSSVAGFGEGRPKQWTRDEWSPRRTVL